MFGKDEDKTEYIVAEGMMVKVGFHPERIVASKENILAMLKELPDEFLASKGGGWTFLNMCNDRHGNQWSDLHKTMEQLVLLGIGAGVAKWQMMEMKEAMPGGMPYVLVLDT
jgi:hypothetical protein